ncbi:MAG TPA: YbaN family protein [Gemmatales bacterium]|nr:YbaN family protein [Gemmatales bacterium]
MSAQNEAPPPRPVQEPEFQPAPVKGIWKWIYITLGFMFLGLAYIGWFLPGIPWSPFVVLASLCFGKSSPRMEAWLLNNKYFGFYLRDLKQYGGIRRAIKIRATCMIVVVVSISVLSLALTDRPWYAWAGIPPLAGIGLLGLWFWIRTLPDDRSIPIPDKKALAAQRSSTRATSLLTNGIF